MLDGTLPSLQYHLLALGYALAAFGIGAVGQNAPFSQLVCTQVLNRPAEHILCGVLQIDIDGDLHVGAGLRLCDVPGGYQFTGGCYRIFPPAVYAVEVFFKSSFKTVLPDFRVHGVIGIFLILFPLLCVHGTYKTQNVGGVFGVVLADIVTLDLYADQQVRHRYPVMGDMIRFGKLQGKLRFGDDFVDMSRWNFNVEVGGGIFSHKSRAAIANEERFRQTNLEADFVMAKQLGYHLFKLNVGYDGFYGGKSLEGYDNHTILAGLHYGVSGQKLLFALGLDYYFNKIDGRIKKHNSFMPYARMGWKSSTEAFVPYVELSSGYKRSDLASLLYSNPYFVASMEGMPYFVQMPNQHYASLKVGIDGNLGKGLFSYSAMFEYRRQEDPLWVDYGGYYDIDYAMYYPSWNDPTLEYVIIDESRTMRVNVGFKLHPIHWFELEAMANVRVHENKDYIPDIKPKFNTSVDVRFMGRKISAEVNLDYRSERRWLRHFDATADHEAYNGWVSTDGEFELGALIEWQINDRWGVYVEGRNLTGSQIHEWLHYYTSSPQGMAGVKMNF